MVGSRNSVIRRLDPGLPGFFTQPLLTESLEQAVFPILKKTNKQKKHVKIIIQDDSVRERTLNFFNPQYPSNISIILCNSYDLALSMGVLPKTSRRYGFTPCSSKKATVSTLLRQTACNSGEEETSKPFIP